jgi:DNA-binding NarL/FixJ family response regulator
MKPFDPEELVVMLDRLLQRKTFMQEGDDSVTIEELREDLSEVKELLTREERLLQDNKFSSSHSAAEDSLLSDDEILILELLCEGYMNKEIASELQYSTRWVEQHLTSMFRKSNCGTRTELVRWAVANEYVDI